jgi:Sec-independent protein translocase protein TatA
MTDDQMDDLKDLIATTVNQAVAYSVGEFKKEMNQRFDEQDRRFDQKLDGLVHEMREGFTAVGDALNPVNDQLEDHGQRISVLEGQAA